MKHLMTFASVAVAGVMMSGAAMAGDVCDAHVAAVPEIVEARDTDVEKDEVIGEIQAAASTDASANTLSASVEEIYGDGSIDVGAAEELTMERCQQELGS